MRSTDTVGRDPINRRSRRLTPTDARRAVYLDFEGWQKSDTGPRNPRLLGVLVGNGLTQHAFTESLRPFVNSAAAKHATPAWRFERAARPRHEVIADLLDRAEREKRPIVAYTDTELRLIESIDPGLGERACARFVNGKITVDRWWARLHRDRKPQPVGLDDYLREFAPRHAYNGPPISPGVALARCAAAALKYRRMRLVPAPTRLIWDALLNYNAADCRGLRRLVVRAANGLAG